MPITSLTWSAKGSPIGKAFTIPAHHSEFKDTCRFYIDGLNLFIAPEICTRRTGTTFVLAECTCFYKIVDITAKLKTPPSKTGGISAIPPRLSPEDSNTLMKILANVAEENMAERMSPRPPRTVLYSG